MSKTVWAAVSPRGKIINETFGLTRRDTEGSLFHFIAHKDKAYEADCWKDWEKGQRRAGEMGYRIVRCKLVEVTP